MRLTPELWQLGCDLSKLHNVELVSMVVVLDGVRPTNGDANAPMLNVEAEFKGPFEKNEWRADGTVLTHLFSYAQRWAPCCFSVA